MSPWSHVSRLGTRIQTRHPQMGHPQPLPARPHRGPIRAERKPDEISYRHRAYPAGRRTATKRKDDEFETKRDPNTPSVVDHWWVSRSLTGEFPCCANDIGIIWPQHMYTRKTEATIINAGPRLRARCFKQDHNADHKDRRILCMFGAPRGRDFAVIDKQIIGPTPQPPAPRPIPTAGIRSLGDPSTTVCDNGRWAHQRESHHVGVAVLAATINR